MYLDKYTHSGTHTYFHDHSHHHWFYPYINAVFSRHACKHISAESYVFL